MITILVIDADPTVRLIARRVLERAGCTVIAAADRGSALTRLASLKVDLLICDIGEDQNGGPSLRDLGSSDPGMRMLVLSRKDLSSPAESGGAGCLGCFFRPVWEARLCGRCSPPPPLRE